VPALGLEPDARESLRWPGLKVNLVAAWYRAESKRLFEVFQGIPTPFPTAGRGGNGRMLRIYRGLFEVYPSCGIPDFGRFMARAAAVKVSGSRARQNLPLTGRSRDPRVSQTGSPTDGFDE